ncbi:MAG: hypothetical protein RR365_08860 [Bacteroides sp.]
MNTDNMSLECLTNLMVKYGIVIRAIPFEHHFCMEIRHKDKHPDGVEYYDEACKRNMLRVTEENNHGGKFVVTVEPTQGSTINYWGKPNRKYKKEPVVFYDSIEQAVLAVVKCLETKEDN